jgi:hypothetical protein
MIGLCHHTLTISSLQGETYGGEETSELGISTTLVFFLQITKLALMVEEIGEPGNSKIFFSVVYSW